MIWPLESPPELANLVGLFDIHLRLCDYGPLPAPLLPLPANGAEEEGEDEPEDEAACSAFCALSSSTTSEPPSCRAPSSARQDD
eukprot:7212676-Pyramimonas_sp.AAC.1